MEPAGVLPTRRRRAVRILLQDPTGSVLLLQGSDPSNPGAGRWWFTPGGGIEGDEDPVTALRRECWEELGLELGAVTGPVATAVYDFPFNGVRLIQDSAYYRATVAHFEPVPQRLSPLEQRFIHGWRWWSRAELASTAEQIYPTDLSGMLDLLD